MSQKTDLSTKPHVQQICERLIECFAKRLQEDKSADLPSEVQEEFIRVWREGTVERLGNQSMSLAAVEGNALPFGSSSSPDKDSSSTKRRRLNAGDSDDEFEGAKLDTFPGVSSQDERGINLSDEELQLINELSVHPPDLSDLVEGLGEGKAEDKIIGRFDKVYRPADAAKPLGAAKEATWSFIIRDGLLRVAGQEFALQRLDAELKEV